jgi:hypothetical protein
MEYKTNKKIVFDDPSYTYITNNGNGNPKVELRRRIEYGIIESTEVKVKESDSPRYITLTDIVNIRFNNGEKMSLRQSDRRIRKPTLIERLFCDF